jgi:hypothetical protein
MVVMISRRQAAAAAVLMWAGGCQSAAPQGAGVAVRTEQPAVVQQPEWPPTVAPHNQPPDEIVRQTKILTDPRTYAAETAMTPSPQIAEPNPVAGPKMYYPRSNRGQSSDQVSFRAPPDPVPAGNSPDTDVHPHQHVRTDPADADPNQSARNAALKQAIDASPAGDPPNVPESADAAGPASTSPPAAADTGDALEQRLRQQAQGRPRDPLAQLDWELFCMLKGNRTGGFAAVAFLPDRDRELVSSLVDGIGNFRAFLRSDSDPMFSKEIGPLLEMADRLRSQANLDIPVIALCKKVDAFGQYQPIDGEHLPYGRENQAIVYCEVENFVPRLDDKQLWETRLTQHAVLYSGSGAEVWSDEVKPVSDICRNRRRDFFLYDVVKLPPTLPPGEYTLKVTVEDQNANKFADNATLIGIVAPVKQNRDRTAVGPLWPMPADATAGGTQYEPVTGQ